MKLLYSFLLAIVCNNLCQAQSLVAMNYGTAELMQFGLKSRFVSGPVSGLRIPHVGSTIDDAGGRVFYYDPAGWTDTLITVDMRKLTARRDVLPHAWGTTVNIEYADNKIYTVTDKGFGYFNLVTHQFIYTDTVTFRNEYMEGGTSTMDRTGKRFFYIKYPAFGFQNGPDTICTYNINTKKLDKATVPYPHELVCLEYSPKNNMLYTYDTSGIYSFDPMSKAFTLVSVKYKLNALTTGMPKGFSTFDSARNIMIFGRTGTPFDTAISYKIDSNILVKDALPNLMSADFEYYSLPVCYQPENLHTVVKSSLLANWDTVSNALNYRYIALPAPQQPTAGIFPPGTSITLVNNATVKGLAPGTYNFCVSATCVIKDNTSVAPWKCKEAVIPSCPAPDTILITQQGTTAVTASWPAASGAIGYQYYWGSTPAALPAGKGTLTKQPTANLSPVALGPSYDICVRSICGQDSSAWTCLTFTSPLGIGSLNDAANNLLLYPNPAHDAVFVHVDNSNLHEDITYVVRDVLGHVCIRSMLRNGDTRIDLQNLTPGIYHVELATKTSNYTGRFIRQ